MCNTLLTVGDAVVTFSLKGLKRKKVMILY